MTLEELKGLRHGEIVVITKVDEITIEVWTKTVKSKLFMYR